VGAHAVARGSGRGAGQTPFKGRALFIFDPDGNETEVNTRYLYGAPLR
jgi:hypothetical protein